MVEQLKSKYSKTNVDQLNFPPNYQEHSMVFVINASLKVVEYRNRDFSYV